MSKIILENQTYFPKSIEYSDIDMAMVRWVEEHIPLVYDGKRLPTYKLFSTQRLSEYLQEWDKQDESGNPVLNFKTVTRENNPQRGDNQGNYFNIPGHRNFAMFYVPVLQENGVEAYDKYTMKQPFQVNFTYSVSVFSNKMDVINKMSELMHYEFSAINCYIAPNGHPMSMLLEDIMDNSEYTIDDRKYYSQTYKVKVRGYIIRKEDYQVERVPSLILTGMRDSDATGVVNRRGKNRKPDELVQFMEYSPDDRRRFVLDTMRDVDFCEVPVVDDTGKPSEIYEEAVDADDCCAVGGERYYNKLVRIVMTFDCVLRLAFKADRELMLSSVETRNVETFNLYVNGELMDIGNDITFIEGDEVEVSVEREDKETSFSELSLVCEDPNVVFDSEAEYETALDEPFDEEEISVGVNN